LEASVVCLDQLLPADLGLVAPGFLLVSRGRFDVLEKAPPQEKIKDRRKFRSFHPNSMIAVNYLVANQGPQDHSEYTGIGPGLDCGTLFASLDDVLRAGRLRVTMGPLEVSIVVKLLDELDHDECKAVISPLEEDAGEQDPGYLQAYFTLK